MIYDLSQSPCKPGCWEVLIGKINNITKIKFDSLNMLGTCHSQRLRLKAVDSKTDSYKMCLPRRGGTGRYRSVIHPFLSDLLAIVRLTSLFLSLLPALPPPTPLPLSFTLTPFAACAELWSSDKWKMYYSAAPLHKHTRGATHRHIYSTRAHVCSTASAWLSVVAVGPSLNGISWVVHISVSG